MVRGPACTQYYSKLWIPHAFPQLTMVDGPELGMNTVFIMSLYSPPTTGRTRMVADDDQRERDVVRMDG
jgi:hypothetical protein